MRSVRYVLLGLVLAASAIAQPVDDTVRVRILSRVAPTDVRVEPIATEARVLVDGAEVVRVAAGEAVAVERHAGGVRVRFLGQERSGQSARIEADGLRLRAGSVDRPYPGALAFRSAEGRLEIVNHAPIEPYVASVVQSEFGFTEIEGAKAQAVLARTYALRRAGAHATYDLVDDQRSQVYRGSGVITATSLRAAAETQGEVLTYRGDLADAYYYSSSGGHTADNDAVWNGTPVPYLRAVPDPYDSTSPDHSWQTSASRAGVLSTLSSRYGGSVEGIEITRRSRSNRVLEVRLIGGRRGTITGSQLRQAVNATAGARTVRSTRFDVSVEGDRYVFRGSGFGHGVGMSQYGALGQARDGRTYREILAHYFRGTEVQGGTPNALTSPGPILVASESGSTTGAQIPREPSALRTRYRPASGRRWPTPRREARETGQSPERPAMTPPQTAPTDASPRTATPAEQTAPAPLPSRPVTSQIPGAGDTVTVRRRRAW